MVHECTTSLSGSEVLERAVQFFAERVPHNAAYPEKLSDSYLVLRGQGGEELTISVRGFSGGTRIRGSTLLFDQALDRFLSTLPPAAMGAA